MTLVVRRQHRPAHFTKPNAHAVFYGEPAQDDRVAIEQEGALRAVGQGQGPGAAPRQFQH